MTVIYGNSGAAVKHIDSVVIGAGIVGLGCALALADAGHEVLILEAESAIGMGVSSRNSEVIHAGIYYPAGSLKAQSCVAGNKRLQQYAKDRGVPYKMVGKLIVATSTDEEETLAAIEKKAVANGVHNLKWLSGNEVKAMEPELNVTAALWSPSTGIIDTHALMLAYLGEAESKGAILVLRCPVISGEAVDGGTRLELGGAEPFTIIARNVVISGGLSSPLLSKKLGLKNIPEGRLCKGNYFSLTGRSPFSRLVYPVPVAGGLGVHYTLDMGGRGRFGPDVEWIDTEDYQVNENRRDAFAAAIQRYWPACKAENLQPAYSGIRPKICGPGEPDQDFKILTQKDHDVPGVVALLGIESPGLTSSLALAEMVTHSIQK